MASNPLVKAIVGSTQSKYAAWAIALTILVLCIAILVMQTDVPIGKRLLGVLFMLLITVPGVALSLVELTCLVTGGSWKTNWWCWLLAWVIAILVILWCIIIIVTTFNTVLTYTDASKKLANNNSASEEEANDFAETILDNSKIFEEKSEENIHHLTKIPVPIIPTIPPPNIHPPNIPPQNIPPQNIPPQNIQINPNHRFTEADITFEEFQNKRLKKKRMK